MDINNEINTLKKEAKELLLHITSIGSTSKDDFKIRAIERIIECIVSAAILEVANLQQQACRSLENESNDSNN